MRACRADYSLHIFLPRTEISTIQNQGHLRRRLGSPALLQHMYSFASRSPAPSFFLKCASSNRTKVAILSARENTIYSSNAISTTTQTFLAFFPTLSALDKRKLSCEFFPALQHLYLTPDCWLRPSLVELHFNALKHVRLLHSAATYHMTHL